jgi:hypothetical protein
VAISASERSTLPPLIERMQDVIWEQQHNAQRLLGVSTATA